MNIKEGLGLKGHINLKLYGPDGKLKTERDVKNVIVTVGKNFLATWLAQATQATPFMNYVGLGTGTNAAAAGDIDLQTPVSPRVAGVLTDSTNVWENQATFGPGIATGAITESGLFSVLTSGTLMARQVFPVVNKLAGDTIVFTWQITIS